MKGMIIVDRMEDNKGTPTKRTGGNNDVQYENDYTNRNQEVGQPKSTDATPEIPQEMPPRT